MEISKKQNEDNSVPPRKSHLIQLLTKANPDHPIAVKYREQDQLYNEQHQKRIAERAKMEETVLPELNSIEFENFYENFKAAYEFFQRKIFDETANNFEARKFARTLCAYFLRKKGFLKSPLLNLKSAPDINKGLMIIGTYGTGKTTILNTFYKMFRYATTNPIEVRDVHGRIQLLGRYKYNFGYHTANDLVKTFEGISVPEEKELFWKRHSTGMKYFDDVMTENTASNYGKTEIFKDILEMRYISGAKTLISLNYAGSTVDETLEAISTKYGERVYDRLFEMFNIIELHGESLRK